MPATLHAKIGYAFKDDAVLQTALTHSSSPKEHSNNERLEFLGDRVLGLAVADLLIAAFPGEEEGHLAKRFTGLVQQDALVAVAKKIDLAGHLRLSAAEMKAGGNLKNKILADAVEALVGAIYLDGGFKAAQDFVTRFWTAMINEHSAPPEDAKSRLQEWVQGRGLPLPVYTLVDKSGSDHAPEFEIELSVETIGAIRAKAASKRAAEKQAAQDMLRKIGLS